MIDIRDHGGVFGTGKYRNSYFPKLMKSTYTGYEINMLGSLYYTPSNSDITLYPSVSLIYYTTTNSGKTITKQYITESGTLLGTVDIITETTIFNGIEAFEDGVYAYRWDGYVWKAYKIYNNAISKVITTGASKAYHIDKNIFIRKNSSNTAIEICTLSGTLLSSLSASSEFINPINMIRRIGMDGFLCGSSSTSTPHNMLIISKMAGVYYLSISQNATYLIDSYPIFIVKGLGGYL